MAAELHAIHIHLWVLTGMLAIILLAAGYCNYSRVKEQSTVSPYKHMKDLWEREQFLELRAYTSDYLKQRPNTSEILLYHTMVSARLKDYEEARRTATKLLDSSPAMRKEAMSLIEMLDTKVAS